MSEPKLARGQSSLAKHWEIGASMAARELTEAEQRLRSLEARIRQFAGVVKDLALLEQHNAALLEALEAYHDWMTADYDDLAEAFYTATRKMAPGKSVPRALAQDDYKERNKLWGEWIEARKAELNANARAAIAKARGEVGDE